MTRHNIVLYDVNVFAVKLDATPDAPATTAISISIQSLRDLAALDSTVVLPDPIPASHLSSGQGGPRSRPAPRSKKPRGSNAHTGPHDPRASGHNVPASKQHPTAPSRPTAAMRPKRRRLVQSSNEDEVSSEHSSEESSSERSCNEARPSAIVSGNVNCAPAEDSSDDPDDERPNIPSGYTAVPWKEGDQIKHFMVWTAIDQQPATWHQGKVIKVLKSNRHFTHDVVLDKSQDKRGIALDAKGYSDGCWVAIAREGSDSSASLAPSSQRLQNVGNGAVWRRHRSNVG